MRVALFVTCLVDLFRPSVGFAAVKLLEDAGCTVEVPRAQTCCGQPAYNSGDRADAKAIALQVLDAFAGYDHVVAPSGSCAGMIRQHYPELFADDPVNLPRAQELAETQLGARLVSRRRLRAAKPSRREWQRRVTYHDACSGLARARRQASAAPAPRFGRRAGADGIAGSRGMLRLWRHVLRQIPGDFRQDGHRQGGGYHRRPVPRWYWPAISGAC